MIVLFIASFFLSNLLFSSSSLSPKDKTQVDAYLEQLKSQNPGDREKAAIAIFHFVAGADASAVVEPLIDALNDPVYRVRVYAATALGRVNDDRAFNALVQKLSDENHEVRKSILHALADQEDPRANNYMIDRLLDFHPDVRLTAAYELGRKKTRSAIVPLIMVLESEENSSVRKASRYALMEIANGLDYGNSHSEWQGWLLEKLQKRDGRFRNTPEDPHPIGRLLRNAVNNEDPAARQKAETELVASGDQAFEYLFGALKDNDWRLRRMAAKVLGPSQNSLAIEPLKAATKDGNEDVRETAKGSLEMLVLNIRLSGDRKLVGEQDFSNLEGLKRAVLHKEAIVRQKAARELATIPQEEAVNVLLIPLLDENANVRVAARDALRQRKESSKVVDGLLSVLQYENVQRKIPLIVDIIGILKTKRDPSSVHVLIDFLKHEDMSVRQHTIDALGAIGTTEALIPLLESLHDEVQFVRSTAAAVLSKSNDSSLIEPCIDALMDPDPFVQDSALKTLVHITNENFQVDPLRWQEWWNENKEHFVE